MSRTAATAITPVNKAQSGLATPSLWVAAGLAMGTLVAVGLARYAYSLLLPAMRADLHWSYVQAGALNAAISIGYLVGALLTPSIEKVLGRKGAFLAGMSVATAGLLATAFFREFALLLALRFVTGLALGPIFICGFNLAAQAGAESGRSTLFVSVYGSGLGLGIVLSGLLLPPLLVSIHSWPLGWIALGILALLASLTSLPAVRHSPATPVRTGMAPCRSLRRLGPLFVGIFFYGAGYFALVTFVIAFLRAGGYSHARIVEFWITAGGVLIVTTVLWGPLLARVRGGWGVALTNSLLIASALLLVMWHGQVAVVLSSVLFGASVLSTGISQFDFGRRLTAPQEWTKVIAALTAVFCVGQTLGPVFCGWISDVGGLRAGLLMAAGLLLVCIAAALLQPHKLPQPSPPGLAR